MPLKKFSSLVLLLLTFALFTSASAQDFTQPHENIDAPAVYPVGDYGNVFIHLTQPSNIIQNYSLLDHPLLNGNPDAIVFITPYWQGGLPLVDEHVGVWYNGEKWAIFNQDNTVDMAQNRLFLVHIQSASESVFQVQASNIQSDQYFELDHPLLNGNPYAQVQITQTWTVNGQSTYVYNDTEPVALYYPSGKWIIGNVGGGAPVLDAGTGFNVQIVSSASRLFTFIHRVAVADPQTFLDHPLLNGNAEARLLVTGTALSYGGSSSPTNRMFNVGYESGMWFIGAPSLTPIPEGAEFFVTILSNFDSALNPVSNAGFEVGQPSLNNKPAGWNAKGTTKRACNRLAKGKIFAYEQYCAAQIPGGNGVTNGLIQNLNTISQFTAGNTPRLGARVMGRGVSAGVKMMAILKLSDDSRVKLKIPAADLQGSYSYKQVYTIGTPLPLNVVSAKLKITHRGTGSLFVDAAFLSTVAMETAYSEPENNLNTIPLPEVAK